MFAPGQRVVSESFLSGGGEIDRLPTLENRLDDVGREVCERQDATNVALIDLVLLGKRADIYRLTAL